MQLHKIVNCTGIYMIMYCLQALILTTCLCGKAAVKSKLHAYILVQLHGNAQFVIGTSMDGM